MRTKNSNHVSLILMLVIVGLGLMWIIFSTYVVPPLIESAYRGQSLSIFNRMVSGHASHPVTEYLSDWGRLRWRVLLDFSLIGLLVVLVIRPEFQRALWGSAAPHPAAPAPGEEKAVSGQTGAHFIAFFAYLAMAVIFTLPASLHPTRALLGQGGDNYQHAWRFWAFANAAIHGHNPLHSDLICYPFGGSLVWATMDPVAAMLAMPLSLSLGPVVSYNISLILQLALGAFFARLLFLRISRSQAAAAIGGMIFGFSPYLLSHALAHISLVTTFPIPLYILALDKLLEAEKPSWKEGSFLGLALLLVALANYQYTVFCLIFTAVVLGIDFGRERMGLLKRVWMPLLASAAIFLLCFSPLLLMMRGSGSPTPMPIEQAQLYSADLLGFFVPSPFHSFLGQYVRKMPAEFFAGGIEGSVYIGFVALMLGAVGFWAARGKQRRWAGRAMVAGILFAALSLGPTVHFLGKSTDLRAPASLLYKVRVARLVREPARLSIMTTLSVSLLATLGLVFFLNKLQRPWMKSSLLCVVGAGLLLENATLPFPSSSLVEPARYWVVPKSTQRCTLPPKVRNCTVLTIPLFHPPYWNNSQWMQMMDGGRYHLVDGYLGMHVPDHVWAEFDQIPIVRYLRKMPTATCSLPAFSKKIAAPCATDYTDTISSISPAPDREFVDSVVQQLNLCAVVVFDASERPAELNYVREVFNSARENTVGSCAVFEIPDGSKNSLFEPSQAAAPQRLAAGGREVYR